MDAQVQSADRAIPVRRQPRVSQQLTAADKSAQAPTTANALRLFDRRIAPTVGSDSDSAHRPQSSSSCNVSHAAIAPLWNWYAYWRDIALDLAGRRSFRKDHHRSLHEVLQDPSGSDRPKARRRTGHASRTSLLAAHAARQSGAVIRVARHSRLVLSARNRKVSARATKLR